MGHSDKRIAGLDGLRAIAVLLVFLQHQLVGIIGGYGVRLFFVISGFLIVGILRRERLAIDAGLTTVRAAFRRFFISRALRIFPIYFFVLGLLALLNMTLAPGLLRPHELVWHALFLSNVYIGLVVGDWCTVVNHLWSVSVEEQFYLLAAPALLIGMLRSRWLVLFVLLGLVTQVALAGADVTSARVYTDSFIGFAMIACGGLLHAVKPIAGRFVRPIHATIALVLYLAAPTVAAIWFDGIIAAQNASIVFAAALVFAVQARPDARLVTMLEQPLVAGFGRVSYGFYVYHYLLSPAVLAAATAGLVRVDDWPLLLRMPFMFAVSLAAAALSWTVIEQPALRWKKRLVSARRADPAPAAALHPSPGPA